MEVCRRYTNLAATIHLLKTRSITLLNPATWDDKNDAYFMAEYKRHKGAKTVLALCFAQADETYHHWRVFSHGSDGVRIEFDKHKLLSAFAGDERIKTGVVRYKRIKQLARRSSLKLEELPFLKRSPFRDEREFRIVFVDLDAALEFHSYDIKISWIRRITLSPWMSKPLATSVKHTLRSIKGCSGVSIARSTLIDNDEWKRATARVSR